MSNIESIGRKQVIPESKLVLLEDFIERARRGEVTDLVVVASTVDDKGMFFEQMCQFENGWHLVGALERAKHMVQLAMDESNVKIK